MSEDRSPQAPFPPHEFGVDELRGAEQRHHDRQRDGRVSHVGFIRCEE
jgi:hypothetical protein